MKHSAIYKVTSTVFLDAIQVWKARKSGSLQTVAVKLISKAGKNDKDVRSLRQEIDILRKLRHPNIIEMLDSFETKTDFCVVTEFAQGECTCTGRHYFFL